MTAPIAIYAPYEEQSKRQRYETLRTQLFTERETFRSHWRDLSDFVRPRRARFFVQDVNKGDRRSQKIINSAATMSLRTLSSGMMAGVTSPARPWFRLSTPDPDLREQGDVKEWLHVVTQRMETVFLRSNLYNALPVLYGDMGLFGTACMAVVEDPDTVIRCQVFPIGSYMIANDDRQKVRVFFRDFQMTVRQIVNQFCMTTGPNGKPIYDFSHLSVGTQNLWRNGQRELWVPVCHVVAPNDDYNPNYVQSKYKRFTSCYYERGTTISQTDAELLLEEKGFDEFPIFAPRWDVTGEDVYATDCPGMTALGDVRQLQIMEKRGDQAIEKLVNPPMAGPTALRTSKASLLPGDITYLDTRDGQQGFKPVYEINPHIDALENKLQRVTLRIQRAFYEDLFLMLAQSDRREITAREIDERHEEKLLALGPVLEQLNQDLLDPLIDRTFAIMNRQGLIPPPPQSLAGQTLKVEYTSVMAQAQKLVGISSLDRFASFVFQAAAVDPTVLDKVDRDQMVQEYGDATGIAPKILVPDEQVQAVRQQRAQQQAAEQHAAQVAQLTASAKNLSQSDTSGKNALTDLLGSTTPSQPGGPGANVGGPPLPSRAA